MRILAVVFHSALSCAASREGISNSLVVVGVGRPGYFFAGLQTTGEPARPPWIEPGEWAVQQLVGREKSRAAVERLTEIADFVGLAISVSSFCVRKFREGDQPLNSSDSLGVLPGGWW